MNWRDLPRNPPDRVLRQFAGTWLIVFLAAGAVQGLTQGRPQVGGALALLGATMGVTGLLRPRWIRWLFVGSIVLVFPLGWMVSQLTLLLMYYAVFTPVALCFRCLGRDALGRRSRPESASYWTAKEQPRDLRRYFRQY